MEDNKRFGAEGTRRQHSELESHGRADHADGFAAECSNSRTKAANASSRKTRENNVKHARGSRKLLFPGNIFPPGMSMSSKYSSTRPGPSSLPKNKWNWSDEVASCSSSSSSSSSSSRSNGNSSVLSRNASSSCDEPGACSSSDMEYTRMTNPISLNGKRIQVPNSMDRTRSSSSTVKHMESASRSTKHTESARRAIKYTQSALKWSKCGKSSKGKADPRSDKLLETDSLELDVKGKSHAEYGASNSNFSSLRSRTVVYQPINRNGSHEIHERNFLYNVGIPGHDAESSSSVGAACPWISRSSTSISQWGDTRGGTFSSSFKGDPGHAPMPNQCLLTQGAVKTEGSIQQHISQPCLTSHWHMVDSSNLPRHDDDRYFRSTAEEQSNRSPNGDLYGLNTVNFPNGCSDTYPEVQSPCRHLSIRFPGESSIRSGAMLYPSPCSSNIMEGSSNEFDFSRSSPLPYRISAHLPYQISVAREPSPLPLPSLDEFSFSGLPPPLPFRNTSWNGSRSQNREFNHGANSIQDLSSDHESDLYSSVEYQHHLTVEGLSEILATLEHIEDFTYEQITTLEETILEGLGLHDRYSDMRLDVDNMSYEELLALEESIGVVSTGLSEEAISKCVKLRKYAPSPSCVNPVPEDIEINCSICQEDFEESQELGLLECGHHYHVTCIKQWLNEKNQCPICKSSAC